ncbi:MAG TPA: hypothetical protein VF175_07995, partial [Lacipirellula sp.]
MPKPWFRQANQTWYVCIGGKQIKLGKNKDAAHRKFKAMTREGVEPGDYTVRQVLQAYWKWAKKNLAASTCENRKLILDSFSKAISPSLKADSLKPLHVQKWLDANDKVKVHRKGKLIVTDKDVSPTTVGDYITFLKGVMNWAAGMGYVESNPLAGMRKPTPRKREFFLPIDAWPRLFVAATDQ